MIAVTRSDEESSFTGVLQLLPAAFEFIHIALIYVSGNLLGLRLKVVLCGSNRLAS